MIDEVRGAEPTLTAICRLMGDDYCASVVSRVLKWRKQATGNAMKSFNAALRKTIKIDGFRNPHRADNHVLQRVIADRMTFSPELLGSVLRIWMESQDGLCFTVSKHLTESEVSTQGLDYEEHRFTGRCSTESWMREKEQIIASHGHLCKDDVALMLCCVTGKLPVAEWNEIEAPDETHEEGRFQQWLESLRELPADAPEWEGADDFVAALRELIQAKEDDRKQIVLMKELLKELKQEFGRELAFFECDTDSWLLQPQFSQRPATESGSPDGMVELLHLTERLGALLTDYRPVHDIAPVFQEEVQLWPKRTELQRQTHECLNQIQQLVARTQAADEDLPQPSDIGILSAPEFVTELPNKDDGTLPGNGQAQNGQPSPAEVQIEHVELERAPASVKVTLDGLAGEDDEREAERRQTRIRRAEDVGETASDDQKVVSVGEVISLEAESKSLGKEIETLRNNLQTSHEIVRLWRVAYETARKELAQTGEAGNDDGFLPIRDVRTAVAVAREKFADELQIEPNSKSEIEENPYEKPREVWSALEWLATTYYRSKVGEINVPRFNPSILKACGWRYEGNQSQKTMDKYRSWYTTSLDGKVYWLRNHIGKGSNKDARYTIRIAFDWDKDRQVVVIGYIGQHQQTNAT